MLARRLACAPTTVSLRRASSRPSPPLRRQPLFAPSLRAMSGEAAAAAAPGAASQTPVEDAIRAKITAALTPTALAIRNDSHAHAHHAAMKTLNAGGAGSPAVAETHFRVHVVSAAFAGQPLVKRHRAVTALLADELRRAGGVHALQLVTRTPEEEEARQAPAAAQSVEDAK